MTFVNAWLPITDDTQINMARDLTSFNAIIGVWFVSLTGGDLVVRRHNALPGDGDLLRVPAAGDPRENGATK